MPQTTIFLAVALIILGVASYLATGMRSPTALIPSFAGVLFLLLGLLALKLPYRKHAMHVALLLAVVGIAGAASGPINLLRWASAGEQKLSAEERLAAGLKPDQIQLTNGKAIRPVAASVQTVMAVLLVGFMLLGIKSFIDARRRAR